MEGLERLTWALDSFQGMSDPDPLVDLLDSEVSAAACYNPNVQLRNFNLDDFRYTCFEMMAVPESRLKIVEGWVGETLPIVGPQITQIAILRIDVDFFEPTYEVLNALYPKVIHGGCIICDDYGAWKGARLAVDQFRHEHNITSELIQTPDDFGMPQPSLYVGTEPYWIKN